MTSPDVLVTVLVMTEAMSLASVKAHLSEVVDPVVRTHERIAITRHGRREAVIISPDDLEALEETLELLSDEGAMQEIAEAREAAARGEGLDAESLRCRYLNAGG